MSIRLLALDIDGTLIRSDGKIAQSDRAAIAATLDLGVAVTLATGRLSLSALLFARSLGLEQPIVCADGAVLFCPIDAALLSQTPLAAKSFTNLISCVRRWSLTPFLFTHEAVCGKPSDFDRFRFVCSWSPLRLPYPTTPVALVGAIGVGPRRAITTAERALREDPSMTDEVVAFPVRSTDQFILRVQPKSCSKATGLSQVVARLGLSRNEVAAIGDSFNDIPMLEWAGTSFAMGQAPHAVKRAAKHALRARVETGGAIAEALQLF